MNRPSDLIRNREDIDPNAAHVIIGDTISCILYAHRILRHGITTPLIMVTEGPNHLLDLSTNHDLFIPDHARSILEYLSCERLHYFNGNRSEVRTYFKGAGLSGDFISSYYLPRVGPWFTHGNSCHFKNFLECNTLTVCHNTAEMIVTNTLAEFWGLQKTENIMIDRPSIATRICAFASRCGRETKRNFFRSIYVDVSSRPNVCHHSHTSDLDVQHVGSDRFDRIFDVSGKNFNLQNARISWKCDPHTYLRLIEISGERDSCLCLPSFYRCVLSIPKVNRPTGVNLNVDPAFGDLLTSYISMSLSDINCPSRSVSWRICAYTVIEDFAQTDQGGLFASPDNTLLVVEGLSSQNIRKFSYNMNHKEIQICMNSENVEQSFLNSFATIVSSIYTAYTGLSISIPTILASGPQCNLGICTARRNTIDTHGRHSPLEIILQMSSMLYGTDIYPSLFS